MAGSTAKFDLTAPKRGRAARSWRRLWQVPTFLFGLTSLLTVAMSAPKPYERPGSIDAQIAVLRTALENGHNPESLRVRADDILRQLGEGHASEAVVHFLAGSVYYRLHQKLPQDEEVRRTALFHLERAHAVKGLAADDEARLNYRLGHLLYLAGTDLPRAVRLMQQGVERGADKPVEGYGILVEACLRLPTPDIDAALLASGKQLEKADVTDETAVGLARYGRAEILARKKMWAEALKELDGISSGIAEEHLAKTRLLQTRCAEQQGLWARSLEAWKDLQKWTRHVPGGAGRVHLAMGTCYSRLEPPKMNDAIRHWQAALAVGGEEGVAAGLHLGQAYVLGPADSADKAIESWSTALAAVRTPADYANPHVSLDAARSMLELGCKTFLDSKRWELTERCADLYKRIAAVGVAEEKFAEASEALARDLASTDPDKASGKHHQAAVGFERAALGRPPEEQAHMLWRSARCYAAAKNHAGAVNTLEKFVKLESTKPRLAEGWFALAEAFAALGDKKKARLAYYQAIEQGNTVFAYRARYQLAVEEYEQNHAKEAIAILQQNLSAAGPVLDRETHQKSLFKLAAILWHEKEYDKGCWYLQEGPRLYPNHPEALAMREMLGQCHRKLAEKSGALVRSMQNIALKPDQSADERQALSQLVETHRASQRDWLRKAADTFQTLADDLDAKAQREKLSPAELILQRSALFSIADVAFELNDHFDAIQRYQQVQDRYRKQIESAHAFQRMFRCWSIGNLTPENQKRALEIVKKSAEAALADLNAIPADHDAFRGGANYWTKDTWLNWFERIVIPQLNQPNSTSSPDGAIRRFQDP
jgi:tetratricopeptide (TPR) repeat protein